MVAMTVKVYGVPLTSPFTVIDEHAAPMQEPVMLPGEDLAV